MGVDVNLYAVGDVSAEQFEAASAYLQKRVPGDGYETPRLRRADYWDDGRVEFKSLDRYYGPGYERGDWPTIYSHIRALQFALPQCAVFYGGDSDDYGQECTSEMLTEMWQHWLGPHGDDYRTFMREAAYRLEQERQP